VLFGTPEFVAPEVINFDRVGFGTDMWSVDDLSFASVRCRSRLLFVQVRRCHLLRSVRIHCRQARAAVQPARLLLLCLFGACRLSGLSPFMGENDNDTYANINRVNYDFDDESFTDISDEAKDFIGKLLIKNKE
jgi:myosin-light-chain kinase